MLEPSFKINLLYHARNNTLESRFQKVIDLMSDAWEVTQDRDRQDTTCYVFLIPAKHQGFSKHQGATTTQVEKPNMALEAYSIGLKISSFIFRYFKTTWHFAKPYR